MRKCPSCNNQVDKLIELDNAEESAYATQIWGYGAPKFDVLCVNCALIRLGISEQDLLKRQILFTKNSAFYQNLLKGRIAQVIVEMIFRNFGYEVHPYGYESYFTNIIKDLKKSKSNETVSQIRSSPDLFIYDREINEGFLLEIKSTTAPLDFYWIDKEQLDQYAKTWEFAILMILHIPTMNIYCKPINKINFQELQIDRPGFTDKEGYSFNLVSSFYELPKYFRLVDSKQLKFVIEQVQETLDNYSFQQRQ